MAQPELSPLTGIFEEDKVIIDFGEHEGKSVLELADTEPSYYETLIGAKQEGDSDFAIRRGFGKQYYLTMTVETKQ